MFNDVIANEIETVKKAQTAKNTENRKRIVKFLCSWEKCLYGLKAAEERRKKKGQGLKILTPGQMLSRLPINLAQLKADQNNL